jgi:hypothetical protein
MVEVFAAHKMSAAKQSFIESWQSATQTLSNPSSSALCTISTVCEIGSR